MRSSVLVVAAHPDDEVLGCGATIAKLSRQQPVRIAILGEGISSRYNRRQDADRRALDRLQEQARAAAKTLKAASVEFGGLPDNRFDEVAFLDIVKQVERWIAAHKPRVIYTHHPGDLNIDHGLTFRAVLTATRPQAGCPVEEVYAFEIASSTEWAFQRIEPPFRPNVFVDVSSTLELKLKALRAYAGEMRPFPHPRSREALEAIARRWGSAAGIGAAEAFELIRSVR